MKFGPLIFLNCESTCDLTDVPASIYDRKMDFRPFDTTHNILRCLSFVSSLFKDRNAPIWRIGNRRVNLNSQTVGRVFTWCIRIKGKGDFPVLRRFIVSLSGVMTVSTLKSVQSLNTMDLKFTKYKIFSALIYFSTNSPFLLLSSSFLLQPSLGL